MAEESVPLTTGVRLSPTAGIASMRIVAQYVTDRTHIYELLSEALALGGTVPLPDLYAIAGARFAFDAETLRAAVTLMEETIEAERLRLA